MRLLERPREEWPALLDEACGDDADLRARVEALLAVREQSEVPATEPAIAEDPQTAPASLSVSTVVNDRYRIEDVLGAGGMGAVYLARDLQLERLVALKIIRGEFLTNRTMAERFRREAIAVARLRHPHIVTVHDYGVDPTAGAYIVMEMLEGHSLRDEIARHERLDARTAIELARQVAQAVGAAHQAGVVHRDIKPANVVLETRDGATAVKVVDFGLAKFEEVLSSSDGPLTKADAIFGTPTYMSPEQCMGNTVDARSDVYALGCVLFEMLTGQPPFSGRPLMALLYKHVNEPPRRPSDLVPGLPPSLDDVVLTALAKRPEERYQTMGAFERALTKPGGAAAVDNTILSGETIHNEGRTTSVVSVLLGAKPPNNLPQATSRFVGRKPQIGGVLERLAKARLVTLVGPGGIGKTRLSLEAAGRALADYDDGVWFVELGPLADPSLLAQEVAGALGIREQAEQTAVESLTQRLEDKQALLVLDNCEHLVEASARLADALLRACPQLRILATSREPLGIAGEAIWPVPTLSVPDAGTPIRVEALKNYEATRLFVERASLVRPGFAEKVRNAEPIAEVCRRLDGIPLAIELAAACTKVLSVEQIAERLDNRFRLLTYGDRTAPRRHQTLRAAIDWSYDMLSEDERALLRRLSVFAGGFTFDAVETVAGDHPPAIDVLDPLHRLIDTSLVVVDAEDDGSVRYRMLESVREYAAEKLAEAAEVEALRVGHRDWYLRLAEEAEPEMIGPDQAEWVTRLEAEHDNLRAALRLTVDEAGDREPALRFCYALGRFWSIHAHLTEGQMWIERVLAAAPDRAHPLRPRVLLWVGQLAKLQGHLDRARVWLDESLALATALGDERGVGAALKELSNVEFNARIFDRAKSYADEALRCFQKLGDRRGVCLALTSLGVLACEHDDYDAAVGWFEQALAVSREIGDMRTTGSTLANLGRIYAVRGEPARGREMVTEAMAIVTELGDKTAFGFLYLGLGLAAVHSDDYDAAIRHYADSIEAYQEFGGGSEIAEVIECVAYVAVRQERFERAVRLIGAADAIRSTSDIPIFDLDRVDLDAYLDAARRSLGPEAVSHAFDEGRAMSFEETIAYAVGSDEPSA